MSVVNQIERHIDLVLTTVLMAILGLLVTQGILEIDQFSPSLAAGIFTVVIGSSITLLVIFSSFKGVIANAEDAELLNILRKVFYWPIMLSIFGFVISIVVTVFSLNDSRLSSIHFIFSLNEYLSLLLSGLLIYSVLAFREVFRTVYYVMVGNGKDSE